MDEMKKEPDNNGAEEIKKALKKQRIIMGVMAAVIVVGAVGAFGYTQGWFSAKEQPIQTAQADIDENAGEWDGTVPEAPKSNPNSESITIPGYPTVSLPADKTEVQVAFSNPEGNPCYFTYQLVLKDTGEVIYESKQIPPGEAVTKAELTRPLEAGEYEAILKISTYHVVTQAGMNGADVETILKVS